MDVQSGALMAEDSSAALIGFAATYTIFSLFNINFMYVMTYCSRRLSVNLAVLNALPFPALDGGQLVFVLVELITKKAVPRGIKDALIGTAIFATIYC